MNGFPYSVKIPKPQSRAESKMHVIAYLEMTQWCRDNISDHWGVETDNSAFLFSYEEEMNKFKEQFRIK
jgi:hypothetical protein